MLSPVAVLCIEWVLWRVPPRTVLRVVLRVFMRASSASVGGASMRGSTPNRLGLLRSTVSRFVANVDMLTYSGSVARVTRRRMALTNPKKFIS